MWLRNPATKGQIVELKKGPENHTLKAYLKNSQNVKQKWNCWQTLHRLEITLGVCRNTDLSSPLHPGDNVFYINVLLSPNVSFYFLNHFSALLRFTKRIDLRLLAPHRPKNTCVQTKMPLGHRVLWSQRLSQKVHHSSKKEVTEEAHLSKT